MADWTFFSNYAHVLFILSSEEDITVRELSLKVGITERSVHKILIDLQENGYVSILKNGRNNQYKLNYNKKLRHPVEKHIKIGQLIDLISK
jgi:DNA-binding transcriptional ArsR family regulator